MRGRWVAGLVGAGLVGWALGAVALDGYGHRTVVDGGYDAIVVAGCRVMPDGTPSLALQRRTAQAVALWRAGVAPRIVFTGGIGTFPPSEAQAAADHATTLGLPAGVAILEETSTSTEENATFAATLLPPGARIVVVTDTYHVFRAERVFGRAFSDVHGAGSVPRWDVRTRGALREVLAVVVYALTDRL